MSLNVYLFEQNNNYKRKAANQLKAYASKHQYPIKLHIYHQDSIPLRDMTETPFPLFIVGFHEESNTTLSFIHMLRNDYRNSMILLFSDCSFEHANFLNQEIDGIIKTNLTYEQFDSSFSTYLSILQKRNNPSFATQFFTFLYRKNGYHIPYDTCLYFEKYRNKIYLHTESTLYTFYGTIKDLRDQLDYEKFLQVNQGCIVNIDRVISYADNTISITDGATLSVSEANRYHVKKRLEDKKRNYYDILSF